MSQPLAANDQAVNRLVEHLFRHKSGDILAILTRIFGLEHWQLAEDVAQDTLLQALQQWSYRGVPDNPGGWLMQVAKHRAIDALRRESTLNRKLGSVIDPNEDDTDDENQLLVFEDAIADDRLTMLFLGCHPKLSPEMQIALLLKTLCGFGVSEIARAFLEAETTIAQRIVRAKRILRNETFELPAQHELAKRLNGVLAVLYLLFNEGYNASCGAQLVREDLCGEAIRLCSLLAQHPVGNTPRVHALLALMWLQASRLRTRTEPSGALLLLADQDRAQWDQRAIQRGMVHLEQAAAGDELSEYHLLAGIAACHALAPSYAETDWDTILSYYDQLTLLNPSPVYAINRAVALAMTKSASAGITALDQIQGADDYLWLSVTYGELHERQAQPELANAYYRKALALTDNEIERAFLQRKLNR